MLRLLSFSLILPAILWLVSCNTTRGVIHLNSPAATAEVDPVHVDRIEVLHDVRYTPASWQDGSLADIYQPAGEGPFPAVLLVHGGGWKGNDGRWQMQWTARALAERGYVVMNVTYRQLPEWPYPAALEDMAEAFYFLRRHADEYGVDRTRIGGWGYSAGGHLVSLLGHFEGSGPGGLRAVVVGGTPQDLRAWPEGPLLEAFLGGPYSEFPARWAHASPAVHIGPQSPPTFFYHGAQDRTVVPLHAIYARELLEREGIEAELLFLRGRGHIGAWTFPARHRNKAINFLDRHLREAD